MTHDQTATSKHARKVSVSVFTSFCTAFNTDGRQIAVLPQQVWGRSGGARTFWQAAGIEWALKGALS